LRHGACDIKIWKGLEEFHKLNKNWKDRKNLRGTGKIRRGTWRIRKNWRKLEESKKSEENWEN
jgi:hypothetical protein